MKLLKLSSCLLITFLCSQTVSSQFFDPSQFTNSDPRQSPLPSNSPQHFPSFDRGLFGSQSSSPFRFFHSPSSPSSSNLQTIQSGDPSNPSFTRFGSFSRPLTSAPEGLPADEISALNEANSRFINPFTQPQAQALPQLNPRPSQPPSDSAFTEPGNFNRQPSPLGLPSPQPASPLGLPQPNEERRFNGEPGVVYEENENAELSSQGQQQFRPQFRQQHSSQPFVNPEFFGFGNQQRPPTSGEQSRPQLPIPQPQEQPQPQPQSQLFQPQEQPRSQFAPPQVPQPQLNPQLEANNQPQLSPETQFQPQPQTSQPQSPQLAVQPQPQFSAQPQFQHQHQHQPQPQPQPQIPQPQTQPELQFPPQPPSNPQFQFSSQFQPQSQPQPQPQPQSQPQPQPQPQLQPQPQFQSNFQFTPPQLQPQTQPQAQPQLQPELQFNPQSRPQPQPNPQQFPPSDSVRQPNPSPQPALQFISLPPPQEAQRQPQPQRQPRPQPQVQPQTQSQPLPQNRPVPAPRPAPRPVPSQPIAPFPVNDDNLLIALYGLEANRTSPPTYRPAPQPTYSQPLSAPTLSRDNNNDNDNNANANGNSNVNFNVDLPLLRSFMEANNIRVHQHTPLYNLRKVESDTPIRTSGETFSFSTPSPTPLIRITTAPTTSTPSPSLNTSNAFNFGSLRDSLVYSDEFTRHQPRTSNQFDSNTSHGTSSFPSTSAPLPAPTAAPRPTQALPNYQPDVIRTSNQPSRTIAVSGQYLGPQLPRRTYAQPTQTPYQPPRPTTTTPSPNTESAFEANFDLSEPENDDEGLANLRSTNYFPDLQRIKPVNRTSTSYSVSVSSSSSASSSPSLSSNYNVGNYPITSLPAATVTRAEVPTTTPYPNEYIRVATSSSLPSSLPVVTEPPYGTSLNRAAASYDLRSSNYPSEPANRVLNIQSSGYGNVRGGANQIARTRYANGRQSSPRSSSAAFPPPSSPSTASPVIYPINFYKHVDELVTPQSNPTTVITTTTTPLPTTFTPEVAPSFSSSDYNNNNNINGDNPEDSSRPVVHSNARQPSVRSNSVRSYLQANNFRSNVRRVVAVRRGPNGVRTNTILRSTAGSPLAPSSSSSSSSSFPVAPNQSQPTSYRIARIVPSQPSPSTTVAPPTTQSQPSTQDLPSNDRVKSNSNLPADTDGDGVPGEAGKDYPTHVTIPKTSFSCANVPNNGYYADTEAQCQVVHLCQSGENQDSFLCPNGTIFNQQKFSCQWWYQVDCNAAPTYYELNDNFQSARINPSSSSSSTRTRSANGLAQ